MPQLHLAEGLTQGSPRIFIATPAITLHSNYLASLMRSIPALTEAGIGLDYCLLEGNCHVDDARNALVAEFLREERDSLIFIDSDVGWDADDLVKLIRHDRDLVAGVYPFKQAPKVVFTGFNHRVLTEFPVSVAPSAELWSDQDGLVEVDGVPTGFLKLSRHCIDLMKEKFGDRKFYGKEQPSERRLEQCILFERDFEGGIRFSGDYAFCRKWRSIGGKVYVDPSMTFTHQGNFDWVGNLGDYWKQTHGVQKRENEAAMDAAVFALREGRADAQAFSDLLVGWGNASAAMAELQMAAHAMAAAANGPILECGSGLTTLVMALANPNVHVHALESDVMWATKANRALKRHGIENATIHFVEMKDYEGGRWYDLPDLPDSFSLVLCDGPWREDGERTVLFEAMGDRIKDATLLADDIDDPNLQPAFEAWATAQHKNMTILGEQRKFAVITPSTGAVVSGAA